ncbi:MAG: hypothetical protein HYW27_01070 [Candidatus Aenigmarchaeota archaeon]|nr:hypothetical protein [Candidatus Aenigmarchaeota archaeon]
MFCIRCGKGAVRGNFCRACFLKANNLFEIEPRTTIYFCEMCGAHHDRRKAVAVNDMINGMIKPCGKIKGVSISKNLKGNRILAGVTCTGSISGIPKKETKITCITVRRHKCENCIKISGNYHEAVIQVRGGRSERIIAALKNILPSRTVARVMRVKNGYDVRIIDKKNASEAIQFTRKKFDVNESYKLVGEKKGTKLYRNYYSVR